MKEAGILFYPICSRCGQRINEKVDYDDGTAYITDPNYLVRFEPVITPDKCPHCGAEFEFVKMIFKLPFDPCVTRDF